MSNINTKINEDLFIEKVEGGSVFLSDGRKKALQKNEKGEEFFRLDNPKSKLPIKIYSDCIKDAIEDVFSGYGHVVLMNNGLFGNTISVIRFLDEGLGQKYREEFMKEFKNVQFCYNVKFCHKNSFSFSFVYEDEVWDTILSFETEKEAEDFIQKIKDDARAIFDKFSDGSLAFDDILQYFTDEKVNPITRILSLNYLEGEDDDITFKVAQNIKH